MKKRSRHVKKSSARKTTRHTTKHTHSTFFFPFSFKRIILVTTCVALFVVGFVALNGQGRQSVAGIQITNGLFVQSTVTIPPVENTVSYNIYYKEKNDSAYKNTVRDIPAYVSEYNISYLTKGSEYIYKISAVDVTGAEFWFSAEKPLENLQSM